MTKYKIYKSMGFLGASYHLDQLVPNLNGHMRITRNTAIYFLLLLFSPVLIPQCSV